MRQLFCLDFRGWSGLGVVNFIGLNVEVIVRVSTLSVST